MAQGEACYYSLGLPVPHLVAEAIDKDIFYFELFCDGVFTASKLFFIASSSFYLRTCGLRYRKLKTFYFILFKGLMLWLFYFLTKSSIWLTSVFVVAVNKDINTKCSVSLLAQNLIFKVIQIDVTHIFKRNIPNVYYMPGTALII